MTQITTLPPQTLNETAQALQQAAYSLQQKADQWREVALSPTTLLASLRVENQSSAVPVADEVVKLIAEGKQRFGLPEGEARLALLLPENPKRLRDFAEWVNARLGKRSCRETKREVSTQICKWLLEGRRLLRDVDGDRPYLLADDGQALPLDSEGQGLRSALQDAGLNPTEPAFAWLLADLQDMAYTDGQPMRLTRWAASSGDTVYLSCGVTRYIVARPGAELEEHANGDAGILFAADACLPAWDWQAAPVDPFTLPAFNPALLTPAEVDSYTPTVQQRLLAAWLCGLVAGVRPLPHLALLGGKGGGKTTLARAIVRTIMSESGDVTPLSGDERDFWTLAVNLPLGTLDNADSATAPWLPDALAVTATGGRRMGRTFYTRDTLSSRPIRAVMLLTSRTATFARPDVSERLLPILTGELADDTRRADSALTQEVNQKRDGMLVHLAQTAADMLSWRAQAPEGLPARFLDFAELVWAWHKASNLEAETIPALEGWRRAQMLAIGEADPLLLAIVDYGPGIEATLQRRAAGELVKTLTAAGADLPWLGGGKAIARRLRELRPSLALAGWTLQEDNSGGQALFTLTCKLTPRLWGQESQE